MKNNFFTKTALLLTLSPFAMSCLDEDGNLIGRKETFSDKQWEIDAWDLAVPLDIDDDGFLETDLMSMLENCDEDNLITFAKNGKVLENAGSDLCQEDRPGEIHTFNWEFDKKKQSIRIKDLVTNREVEEWDVMLQTDNRLWIKFNRLPDRSKNSLVKSIIKLGKK